MASNFNNSSVPTAPDESAAPASTPAIAPIPAPMSPGPALESAAPADVPSAAPPAVTSDNPESAAFVRFRSCRWQQPKDESGSEFCTHREVKPYAGTSGFDADAWCPDCQYHKLRRAPKKRNPNEDYSY